MSFLKSLKSAFGFGPDPTVDDEDKLLADDSFSAKAVPGAVEAANAEPEPAPEAPVLDPRAVRGIFTSVVSVFNESLPQFVSASIDTKAQEEFLYKTLDQSLKDYLTRLVQDARVYAEGAVRHENHETLAELARLRQEKESLEHQRSSIKEQQLSADRRRRAMADRVQDLEQQLAALEADREQFELENKSLLNKIKLSEIQPAVVEELSAEVERLRAQLAAAGSAPGDAAATPAPDPAAEAALESANEKIAALEKDLAAREEAPRTATEMYNSLQHELVEERRKAADASAGIAADLDAANAGIRNLRKELEEKDAQLDEAARLLKGMEQLNAQMLQVETAITKRDERIKALQQKNRDLRSRLDKAEKRLSGALTPSLPFGDSGLADPHEDYNSDNMIATSPIRPEDLDDGFREVDWLTGTPPKGTIVRSELTDEEFGYQEPPRKPKPKDHDSQLSLF
ncbi:MAG: hypothetical protein K2M06_02040 [Muribaculaceae bacterium]|nr:hypothetical protein [Muribaculaceae bacterium]